MTLLFRFRVNFIFFSQWQHVETIELVNDGTGLGFGIVGGKTTGVIVKTILPGGIADQVIALTCGISVRLEVWFGLNDI